MDRFFHIWSHCRVGCVIARARPNAAGFVTVMYATLQRLYNGYVTAVQRLMQRQYNGYATAAQRLQVGRFEADFGRANGAHSIGNISFIRINSMVCVHACVRACGRAHARALVTSAHARTRDLARVAGAGPAARRPAAPVDRRVPAARRTHQCAARPTQSRGREECGTPRECAQSRRSPPTMHAKIDG
jgi:hypothetical protein